METLRERWAGGHETLGAWLTIPSSVSAEAAARHGFDYVCTDNQHGALDYGTSVAMIQAIALGGSRPVARVPWNEPGIIGKFLDAGAEGVIVPMVNSAAEAEAVVRACRYPPDGQRSFGPLLAAPRRPGYTESANDTVAVIVMIETTDALDRLDAILDVPGVDAAYIGPADLSLSLGLPPGNHDDDPRFADALAAVVAACRRHGVVPGIHSNGTLAPRRREQGFQLITVAADLVAMNAQLAQQLDAARAST